MKGIVLFLMAVLMLTGCKDKLYLSISQSDLNTPVYVDRFYDCLENSNITEIMTSQEELQGAVDEDKLKKIKICHNIAKNASGNVVYYVYSFSSYNIVIPCEYARQPNELRICGKKVATKTPLRYSTESSSGQDQ